jgi:lipoprotein NlpD
VSTPSGTKVQGAYHTVKRGENLWRIAKTYRIDLQLLAEINDIDNPAKIRAGEKMFIPGAANTKKVVAEANAPAPSSQPDVTTKKDAFIWPVDGKVVSKYGVRNGLRYDGIEIAAVEGTPVRAANSGTVVYDGSLKGYGNIIIIKHKDRFKTVYAYNRVNLVVEGREVNRGESIATVGKSSRSSKSSLHFQVWKGDKTRNPLFFLP